MMTRSNRSNGSNGGGDRNGRSVPWGRAGSQYRPGLFIRNYFLKHGEACAAEIYRAMGEMIENLNEETF